MDKELKKISIEYIGKVENVCLLMLKALKIETKKDLLNYRIENPIGQFDGINNYQFHGRGCKFFNNEISINWDFGFNDNWCGLNPWLLAEYIKSNNIKDLCYQDGDEIKAAFEEATEHGEMEKKYDLYYIK